MINSYRTILTAVTGMYSESGSRFLSYCFHAENESTVKIEREKLKKLHHKAVHVVMASRIGFEHTEEKFSDDGEPAGSSGRPVLNILKSRELINVALLVVRYYGGKKLGIQGLIRAYSASAIDALDRAEMNEIHLKEFYRATCKESDFSLVTNAIMRSGAGIENSEYGEICTFIIAFRRDEHQVIFPKLRSIWQMELQFLHVA